MRAIRRFEKYEAAGDAPFVRGCAIRVLDAEDPALGKNTESLRVYGWALATGDQADLHIVVREEGRITSFPSMEPRPDVAQFFGDGANPNCGFQFVYALNDWSRDVRVFVRSGTQEFLLGRISLTMGSSEAAPPEIVHIKVPKADEAAELASISPKALRGKNGFFFLGGADANGLVEHITGARHISEEAMAIHKRNFALIEALTCPYAVVVVPEAHVLYQENLPDGIKISEDRPVTTLRRQFGEFFDYPLETLLTHKAAGKILYTGNNSHWTDLAALHTWEDMRKRLGRDFPIAGKFEPSLAREAEDLRIATPEEARMREMEARKSSVGSYFSYFSVGILNHGNLSGFYNPIGTGLCLAFGTSFSNRLLRVYANDFKHTILCYGTTIDPLMVDLVKPDTIILEMPERFIHFPATAVPGSTLLSCLIASRSPDYEGLMYDRFDALPVAVPDVLKIGRGLAGSAKLPELLDDALDLLEKCSPEIGRLARNIVSFLPKVKVPNALRTVISGQYTNGYALGTMLRAVEEGELDDATVDIFPDTEMGMLVGLKLILRRKKISEAKKLLNRYVSVYGVTDYAKAFSAAAGIKL